MVPFHILSSGVPKHLRRPRSIGHSSCFLHHLNRRPSRVRPILEETLQAPGEHLLEADDHDTVSSSVRDGLSSHMQPRGPSRAIVVDVIDRNLGHAELVEYPLAASAIAIAVACNSLVDIVIVDLGVQECFDTGFETELGVVDLAARFDELGQAYSNYVGWWNWLLAHDEWLGMKIKVPTSRREG